MLNSFERVNSMIQIGGREWRSKNGLSRVYFSPEFLENAVGLSFEHYTSDGVYVPSTLSGNVVTTELARGLRSFISKVILYYDIKADRFEIYHRYKKTRSNSFGECKWVLDTTIKFINASINNSTQE